MNLLFDVLVNLFQRMFFSCSVAIKQSYDKLVYLLLLNWTQKVEVSSISDFRSVWGPSMSYCYKLYEMKISPSCFDSMKTIYTLRASS